jgi:DNA polymerase III epsilon subunit-like protein
MDDIRKIPLEELEFVVFDTETTGIFSINAWLLELGAVRTTGSYITDSVFHSLARSEIIIPADVIAIHGITDEMVADAPDGIDVVERFFKWGGNKSVYVTYNAAYDLGVIATVYRRAGRKPPKDIVFLDILELAQDLMNVPSFSLESLAEIARDEFDGGAEGNGIPIVGVDSPDAIGSRNVLKCISYFHRALPDATNTALVLLNLIRLAPNGATLEEIIARYDDEVSPSIPAHFADIPEGEMGFDIPKNLWMVHEAINNQRTISIWYSGGRGLMNPRRVQPMGIYGADGQFYLEAFCFNSGFIKTFRVDKITKVMED